MSHVVAEPNEELAIMLLADGHDEKELRRHAGFASLRDARAFAARPDVRAEVQRAADARARRLGLKAMNSLEGLLDSDSTDGRTRVAAARTAMEVGGLLRRDARVSETKHLRELTAAELSDLIEETRADLERRVAAHALHQARLIASTDSESGIRRES